MDRLRSICWASKTLATAALCWAAVHATAFAGEAEGGAEPGALVWVKSYGLVVLGVALGMMVVCRSTRRRDRAKPETYGDAKATKTEKKKGTDTKKKTKKKKRRKK